MFFVLLLLYRAFGNYNISGAIPGMRLITLVIAPQQEANEILQPSGGRQGEHNLYSDVEGIFNIIHYSID